MRFVLHLEHLRHFQNHGSILFEALITPADCSLLETTISQFVRKISKNNLENVRWRESVFRSIPEISFVIQKRRLSTFAAELVHRPKLSLVRDYWLFPGEEIPQGNEDCQLFLPLSGRGCGSGIFFIGPYPQELYEWDNQAKSGLLLMFSFAGHAIL